MNAKIMTSLRNVSAVKEMMTKEKRLDVEREEKKGPNRGDTRGVGAVGWRSWGRGGGRRDLWDWKEELSWSVHARMNCLDSV